MPDKEEADPVVAIEEAKLVLLKFDNKYTFQVRTSDGTVIFQEENCVRVQPTDSEIEEFVNAPQWCARAILVLYHRYKNQ